MTRENLDFGKFMLDFPSTLNEDAPSHWPRGNEEPTLNKRASFQAPLSTCTELAFSGCVGHLPGFKWMNDGPLQSPLILC